MNTSDGIVDEERNPFTRSSWVKQGLRLTGGRAREFNEILGSSVKVIKSALLLNLPCNAGIGGGGGIGLIVGMSGLITYTRYLLLIAVSISPVPIAIFIKGSF